VQEPLSEVVRSGTCKVRICTEVDLGDYLFRYYAPKRTTLIRYIPKGACECSFTSRDNRVDAHILISIETPDAKQMHSITVVRINRADPSSVDRWGGTTYEEFVRLERSDQLEEISDFKWKNEDFANFRVFRGRQVSASGARRYFFVPKTGQFRFRGKSEPIVFSTPLPRRLDAMEADGPRVSARVHLSNEIGFFQPLIPRLFPSDTWIASMERSAEMIDTRLFPKLQR
jgi:hypothetical protein